MTVLTENKFNELITTCHTGVDKLYCIVMKTISRKHQMMENFRRYRERYGISIYDDYVLFQNTGSMIDVFCLSDCPGDMYDDILFDVQIDATIGTHADVSKEVAKFLCHIKPNEVLDLGELKPSEEILFYIQECL